MFFILSKIKSAVSFFEEFFESQKELHQKLFSSLSFSVGDVIYVLIGTVLLFFLLKIVKKGSRHKYLLKLVAGANIFYFVYQIFWGMLYFQAPLRDQFSKDEVRTEEVKALALKYLNLCKESRLLVKENSGGVFQVQNLGGIKAEIIRNQNKLPVFLPSKKGFKISSAKPGLFDEIMSYSGILGYYNPFTAEVQYNPNLPSTSIPFTLAHEFSHQLGYAREQEANFIGYLSGKNSQNVELRYSTEYFVLKSLLNSLVERDPQFVHATVSQYSAGMNRDRFAEKIFRKKHEGYFNDFFGITNDLFLKSNQQDGSITYSYFVDLLVRYELQSG